MTATRSWPTPPTTNLIHFIGDLHYGAVNTIRTNKMVADLSHKMVPKPVAHIQIGDLVDGDAVANDGSYPSDATALAFLNGLNAPWYAIAGNHDFYNNTHAADDRTITEWTAVYGMPRHLSVDLGFVQILGISGAGSSTQLSATGDLDWLDAQLAAATKECIVLHHKPLKNTIAPTNPGGAQAVFSSNESGFYAICDTGVDDAALRTVLNNRSAAKMFITGHLHSPLFATNLVTTVNLGSRSILCADVGALYYVGRAGDKWDQIYTVYLNYYPGDRAEFRWRDHGAGVYDGPAGVRVTTLSIPA